MYGVANASYTLRMRHMRAFRSFALENIDKVQLAPRLLTAPHLSAAPNSFQESRMTRTHVSVTLICIEAGSPPMRELLAMKRL